MPTMYNGSPLDGHGGIYLTGEDNLRLTTFGSVVGAELALEGRIVAPDGCIVPIVERQVPTSDRTSKTSIHGLREGWLTNVQIRASVGTVRRGQVFAVLELIRGNAGAVQPLGCLLQGYVDTAERLAWPGCRLRSSLDGAGALRTIVGTDPAAGVEISETVPTGARWRLHSIKWLFVTSAVVANRVPSLIIDDGVTSFFAAGPPAAQAASQSVQYTWAAFGYSTNNQGIIAGDLPSNGFWLAAGSRIRTSTGAIDAADNYSAPQYLVEEWIEP